MRELCTETKGKDIMKIEKLEKKLSEQQLQINRTKKLLKEVKKGLESEQSMRNGLEAARNARGLTKVTFAEVVLGISPQSYQHALKGIYGYRGLRKLLKKTIK